MKNIFLAMICIASLAACRKEGSKLVEYEITPVEGSSSGTMTVSYTVADGVQYHDTLHFSSATSTWTVSNRAVQPQDNKPLNAWSHTDNGDPTAISYFFNAAQGSWYTLDAIATDGFDKNVNFEFELNESVIADGQFKNTTEEGTTLRRIHIIGQVK